ncbi:sugar O-acetyltransferase [Massilia sp. ST3]|uniref:sugar O-acetyltransferase n=1 Tax=Massilia sp. ST3 TaxID=2824903 RepID=UPI001B83FB97|nr:sugar O-acetyltransferase [Massilia sp. ST3]MBQ5947570.1 sugar O-acetyltransferase [Massilia sp. ST3]
MGLSEKQKMLAGRPYHPGDPELRAEQAAAAAWLARYNAALAEPVEAWQALLAERFGQAGQGAILRPPFHCDYGWNIRLGARVFVNFGCVFLDVARIAIGDDTRIGPGVHIYTADHPRDPARRRTGVESGRPVTIGSNVWIGGGAIILPGITIGDDAIVGAGSVVTHDVAAGTSVAGNPAQELAAG